MQTNLKRAVGLGAGALLLMLQACGTTMYVSQGISDDGKASQVVFPDIERDAWIKEGTFPNLDNLRAVGPGVTKPQLYALLGSPHFAEAAIRVREWDYVFRFRGAKADGEARTCQYKVIFDKEQRGQTFLWQPADCAEVLRGSGAAAAG